MYQLGQVMTPIDPVAGKAFAERATMLKECGELIEQMLIHQGSAMPQFRDLMSRLIAMGREWEAWAWLRTVRERAGGGNSMADLAERLAHLSKDEPPRFYQDRNLALTYDLSGFPPFETILKGDRKAIPTTSGDRPLADIRFEDKASAWGIDFSYFQGPDPQTPGVRIFESTGGGVGILDFDLDGCPDLFLTQGEDWPPGNHRPVPSEKYCDRLYRNSGDGLHDVTFHCGMGTEAGYGQGCSCGDFNNDGFADLYVANIGVNQLWLNNGNGTFSDATAEAELADAAWTTSCLIVDLDADGTPDLYDVNYLQGDKVFTIECNERNCSVHGYEGAPDQVLLSLRDGRFAVVPQATPVLNSKGLGIVTLFPDGHSRPSLFIANDQVPNFYLRPTEIAGKYVDEAQIAGLALNVEGKPTACMGIAAADIDHDARTDLFVTNFKDEANNLYLQRDGGLFEDAVVGAGLMMPGIPYVGWGAQFIDADNDGELDLAVANGHVADFQEEGIDSLMPTQFFRSVGGMRFVEERPADVGPLFDRRVLGRALATVDFNRDGRVDFVVSCIGSPVILAENQTTNVGRWLDIRLHARNSARDAIGAVVNVRCAAVSHRQQLLSGDGYQTTNERRLHFGLGTAEQVDEIQIVWPSGGRSRLTRLPADGQLNVVEGITSASLWRAGMLSSIVVDAD
jgi:hypothetical protein